MKLELYPKNKLCPCNSGIQAIECCFLKAAPISRQDEMYEMINIEPIAIDSFGNKMKLPPNVKLDIVLNIPQQLDLQIERVVKRILVTLKPKGDKDNTQFVLKIDKFLNNIIDSLYAVRYHQRSFLARLQLVTSQQILLFESNYSEGTIRFNDRPLKHELESFLIRTRGTIDAICRFSSVLIGKNPKTYGGFRKLLEQDNEINDNLKQKLIDGFSQYQYWISEIDRLRNEIVHEGNYNGFEGIGSKGILTLDARILGINAGAFCIDSWKNLIELVTVITRECARNNTI